MVCRTNRPLPSDAVLTTHHANDQTETILLNLLRGSGATGLAGIPPSVPLDGGPARVLRPLLQVPRKSLEQYAREHQLQWREDSSNEKGDYLRNALRHQVVPLLEQFQPALQDVAGRNAEVLRQGVENYRYLLEKLIPGNDLHSWKIADIQQLPYPAHALFELLKSRQFTVDQCRQIAEHLDRPGSEYFSKTGWRLVVDRQYLLLEHEENRNAGPRVKVEEEDLLIRLPDGGTVMMGPVADYDSDHAFDSNPLTAEIAADHLQFPLLLRYWQAGDTFQPFGMEGRSKKVQDLLTDHKIPRPEKEKTWILVNGDGAIIWVVGIRTDERFRVSDGVKKFRKILFMPKV